MKKLVTILVVLSLMVCVSAQAAVYAPSDATLDTFVEDTDYQSNSGQVDSINTSGLGITVAASTTATSGWWACGVSKEYLYPNGLDLSSFDTMDIMVKNNSNSC